MADPPTPSPPPSDDPSNDSLTDYRGRVHDLEEKLGERDTLIEELREQVRGLEEKAGKNSGNSSRAPSTDTPEQRARRRRKPKSARNRGAQPGHPKHERALWPESALDAHVNHLPNGRCGCGTDIVIVDEPLFRHQVFDVPVVKYTVVEHRLFGGVCPSCADRHHGVLPRTVPSGQMGPNLVALIAGLSGDEQLSIRKIRKHLIEHFDLSFSVGAIFQAQGKMNAILAAPYRAIGEFVRSEPVVHADETRHFRGNNPYWLWVLAVGCACYFVTHYSRGKAAADSILGNLVAYLVTDDYIGYANYDDAKRQLCWAHLLRKFVDIGSRTGRGGVVGRRLHAIGLCVFRVRHRFEQGRCTELQYMTRMNRLRRNFTRALDVGIALQADGRTHHQCRHLANREAMLWAFMKDHRIPLTNNLTERALRPYVIWRKLLYATRSHQGDQFRPMILSVLGTAHRLGVSGYGFLRTIAHEMLEFGEVVSCLPLGLPRLPAPPPG